MNSTSSSLGLLSGYNSSSSDEEEGAESNSGPVPSKTNFFAEAASSSEDEENSSKESKKPSGLLPSPLISARISSGPLPSPLVSVRLPSRPLPSPLVSARLPSGPLPSPLASVRLPAPRLGTQNKASPSGVFSNPFRDEERAQLSILERHVKLSDSNWAKGGKGICLAYQRDGRCRYGTKCKYSHGTDLPLGATLSSQGELSVSGGDAQEMVRDSSNQGEVQSGEEVGQETQAEKGKRKKPGLSNTLIPPKKALKSYQKHQSSERPWAL